MLAIDHRQALEFFVIRLKDISEPTVNQQELLYSASVLAHYAQVSTEAGADVPVPGNLNVVFDHFVLGAAPPGDAVLMEAAGAQCLLLAGFFARAARHESSPRKARAPYLLPPPHTPRNG